MLLYYLENNKLVSGIGGKLENIRRRVWADHSSRVKLGITECDADIIRGVLLEMKFCFDHAVSVLSRELFEIRRVHENV